MYENYILLINQVNKHWSILPILYSKYVEKDENFSLSLEYSFMLARRKN